jgi:hypothetical protein
MGRMTLGLGPEGFSELLLEHRAATKGDERFEQLQRLALGLAVLRKGAPSRNTAICITARRTYKMLPS